MRVDLLGSIPTAERAAEAQVIGIKLGQRRDVFKPQRSGEARHQAELPRSRNEIAETLHREVIRQRSSRFACRIEHGSRELGLGEKIKQAEVGRAISKQDGNQPCPLNGDAPECCGADGVIATREKADLHEVHTGRGGSPRRLSENCGNHRQIAQGGADPTATSDSRDDAANFRERCRAERALCGILYIDEIGTAIQHRRQFVQAADAGQKLSHRRDTFRSGSL